MINYTALRLWLNRIDYNMTLYLNGEIKWNQLEMNHRDETMEGYRNEIEQLYFLNQDRFFKNLLVNRFNGERIELADFTEDYLKEIFYTKLEYLLLNNINLYKTDIIEIINSNPLLFTNTEKHFLEINSNIRFGNIMGFENIYIEEIEIFKRLQKKIQKNFEIYL